MICVGIDIGSSCAKTAVTDGQGYVLWQDQMPTGWNSLDAAEEIRRRLLIQSRDLLRDIPRKYPQAGLDDKVAGNLATVEAALRSLEAPPAPQQPYGQNL